jgi:hypothetical protein
MNAEKLLTTLLLLLPGLSWGPPPIIEAPEPGILPLLAAGGCCYRGEIYKAQK